MGANSFSGDPRTLWLSEDGGDRRMPLLQSFWYDEPAGKRWQAPEGSVVDGASIPQALWSSIGSPYTEDYRRASIVHDVACDDPAVPGKPLTNILFRMRCGRLFEATSKTSLCGRPPGGLVSGSTGFSIGGGAEGSFHF